MSVKRDNYLEWQEYFMSIAFLSAQRSKDPRTQVGAVIVNKDNKIVGIGYNGMPIGCNDDQMPWNRAKDSSKESWFDSKSPYVCHAELNAVLNKNQADINGCTIFVALFPCNMCSQIIIQSGIKEVVFYCDKYHDRLECVASRRLLDTAGVKYRQFKPRQKKVIIDFDIIEDSAGPEPTLTVRSTSEADPYNDNCTVGSGKKPCNGLTGGNTNGNALCEMTNNNNIVRRKNAILFNHAEQQNLPQNINEEFMQNTQDNSPSPSRTTRSQDNLELNFALYSLVFILCVVGFSWLVANTSVLVPRK